MERSWRPGLPIDLPRIYFPTEMDEWRLYETEDLEPFVQQAFQSLDQRGHRQMSNAPLFSWFARAVLDESQTYNNTTVANYSHSQHIYPPPPPPQVTYVCPQQQTPQSTHHWYPHSYSDSPQANHTAPYLTVDRLPSWVQPEVVEAKTRANESTSPAEKQQRNKSHFRPQKKKAMRTDQDSGSETDAETDHERRKRKIKKRRNHKESDRSKHNEPSESDHDDRTRRSNERRKSRFDTQLEDDSDYNTFRRNPENHQSTKKVKSKQGYHDTSDHEIRKPHHHTTKSRKSTSRYCPTHRMHHIPQSPPPSPSASTSPSSSPSPSSSSSPSPSPSPPHPPCPSSPSPSPSPQPPPFDPHATLGTTPSTPLNIIRIAANQLSLRYHPDKQVGKSEAEVRRAAERMVEINRAREVLLGGG